MSGGANCSARKLIRGNSLGKFSGSPCRIRSLCVQRLWFMLPWLTHGQTAFDVCWANNTCFAQHTWPAGIVNKLMNSQQTRRQVCCSHLYTLITRGKACVCVDNRLTLTAKSISSLRRCSVTWKWSTAYKKIGFQPCITACKLRYVELRLVGSDFVPGP